MTAKPSGRATPPAPSAITLRAARGPADRAALAEIDTSFTTDRVYDVLVAPLGFTLVERPVLPATRKRYDVAWEDLATADAVVVAERAGVAVGFAALRHEAWNRRAIITDLYVHSAARGTGVGATLVNEMQRLARTAGARCLRVETQNVNAPAIHFYQRAGFTLCGLDTSLYDPMDVTGETAVFLALSLEQSASAGLAACEPDA